MFALKNQRYSILDYYHKMILIQHLKEGLKSLLDIMISSGRYPILKQQWENGNGEGGYIGTNHGIIATLRVLKEILNHLNYKDNISVRTLKTNVLLQEVEKYLKPVITYLAATPFDTLKLLRITNRTSWSRCK